MIDEQGTQKQNHQAAEQSTARIGSGGNNNTHADPSKPNAYQQLYDSIGEFFSSWRERRRARWKDTPIRDRINVRHSLVIAWSTFLYMIFAGWTLWEIHSGSTDTHNLAIAARIQANAVTAQVAPVLIFNNWFNVYHVDEGKEILFDGTFRNEGKTPAWLVMVATKMEFRASNPLTSDYQFSDDQFKPLLPTTLEPFVTAKANYGNFSVNASNQKPVAVLLTNYPRLYVWGRFKYKDFTNEWVHPPEDTFCGYVLTKSVLDAPPGPKVNQSTPGYHGSYTECY